MNIVPKTTLFLNISMCLVFSLFLLSCARTSNSQQTEMAPLVAALKVLDVSIKDTISVQVEFTLNNMTANNLEVLKWGTPFDDEFSDDMFDIQVNGKRVRYIGMQIKRGTPQRQDYVKIGPHGILSATLLLEKGYALEDAGQYSVRYSKSYVSVRSNGSADRLVPVDSNQVVFVVPE